MFFYKILDMSYLSVDNILIILIGCYIVYKLNSYWFLREFWNKIGMFSNIFWYESAILDEI